MKRLILKSALILLVAGSILGCKPEYNVILLSPRKPASTLIFAVKGSEEKTVRYNRVTVYEVVAKQERSVWEIQRVQDSGASYPKTLRYGHTPDGFVTNQNPETLKANTEYVIWVKGLGQGGVRFRVDADTRVQPSS